MTNKILALVLCFCLIFTFTACSKDSEKTEGTQTTSSNESSQDTGYATSSDENSQDSSPEIMDDVSTENLKDNYTAIITVRDYGKIKVFLDSKIAPITVANFVNLVNEGFYNGITFHRIINGFMIQGGDPTGTGMSGSDKKIKGEFASNGVENNLSHKRGVISMARRSNDLNSASSQFFIVHKDSTFLDGQYAAFGYVTDGLDVVDNIAKNTPVIDSNGTVLKNDQPVITSIELQ